MSMLYCRVVRRTCSEGRRRNTSSAWSTNLTGVRCEVDDDDSVGTGVGEFALADHAAECLHSYTGVEVDEKVVCLGEAGRGGRKGSEDGIVDERRKLN